MQIVNSEKIKSSKNGMANFVIRKSHEAYEEQHASLGFYSESESKKLLYTQAILDNDGHKWLFKGINSVKIAKISEDEIKKSLRQLGFTKITTFGSVLYDPLFKKPFEREKSSMLNIVAER